MGKIKVNTHRLGNDVDQISACIQSMKQQIELLRNCITRMNSMWTSEAKTQFVKDCETQIQNLSERIKYLERMYKYEDNARRQYEACENRVSQVISRIRI